MLEHELTIGEREHELDELDELEEQELDEIELELFWQRQSIFEEELEELDELDELDKLE